MANALVAKLASYDLKFAEIERRARNRKRTGQISAVDTKAGLARVMLVGGDKPFITGWLPWKEVAAGHTSTHIPPVVGQQVDVLSENGELTDGVIDFSIHSNKNPRPHDGPQTVIVHGDTKIVLDDGVVTIITAEAVTVKCANTITLDTDKVRVTNELRVDGNLSIGGDTASEGAVNFNGSSVSHNGVNIGDDHKHTGVKSGGDNTNIPVK